MYAQPSRGAVFSYNGSDELATSADADGNTTHYGYNNEGLLSQIQAPNEYNANPHGNVNLVRHLGPGPVHAGRRRPGRRPQRDHVLLVSVQLRLWDRYLQHRRGSDQHDHRRQRQ